MILYRVTIDDPATFTKPWTIEVPYTTADEKENKIFESACHEGNYALHSGRRPPSGKRKARPVKKSSR